MELPKNTLHVCVLNGGRPSHFMESPIPVQVALTCRPQDLAADRGKNAGFSRHVGEVELEGQTVGGNKVKSIVVGLVVGLIVVGGGAAALSSTSASPSSSSGERLAFESLPPARVLDTRKGIGAPKAQVGPGATLDVQITNFGGVPSDAVAVVLNVTVTGGSEASHLTAWPAGADKPTASNLNFNTGETIPNLVTVRLGATGGVSMFNNSGNVDVIADVAGYYHAHDHDDRYYTEAEVDTMLASRDTSIASLSEKTTDLEGDVAALSSTVTSLVAVNETLTAALSELEQRPQSPVIDVAVAATTGLQPGLQYEDVPGGTVTVTSTEAGQELVVSYTTEASSGSTSCGIVAKVLVDGDLAGAGLLLNAGSHHGTGASFAASVTLGSASDHVVKVQVSPTFQNAGCSVGTGQLTAMVTT